MSNVEEGSSVQRTKSQMAGLVMPVSRIERNLRKGNYAKRISPGGAVFLASVLEYLCAEVLELSADACIQNNKRRITPRHVMLAIENDPEIKELLKDVTISEGGVMPGIHPSLLPKRSKRNQPDQPEDTVLSEVQSQEL